MSNKNNILGPQGQIEQVKESKIKKYIFPIFIGIGLFVVTMFIKNPFTASNAKEVFRYLCDDATIPAVLLFCLWGLSFTANKGTYDGLSYSFKTVLGTLIPAYALKKGSNFGDYKAEKEKNRKPVVNSYLVVSLGFLVLTIIFFIIYTCL